MQRMGQKNGITSQMSCGITPLSLPCTGQAPFKASSAKGNDAMTATNPPLFYRWWYTNNPSSTTMTDTLSKACVDDIQPTKHQYSTEKSEKEGK